VKELALKKCNGPTCKAMITFGRTKEGRIIPLDPKAPIWLLNETGECSRDQAENVLGVRAMVQHHATCRDVVRFTSSDEEMKRLRSENDAAKRYIGQLKEEIASLSARLADGQRGQVAG